MAKKVTPLTPARKPSGTSLVLHQYGRTYEVELEYVPVLFCDAAGGSWCAGERGVRVVCEDEAMARKLKRLGFTAEVGSTEAR